MLVRRTNSPLRQERSTSSGSPRSNVPNQPYVGGHALSAEPPLPSVLPACNIEPGPKAVVCPRPSPASLQEPRHRAPDATGARGGPGGPIPRSSQHTTSSDQEVKQTRAGTAARVRKHRQKRSWRYVTDRHDLVSWSTTSVLILVLVISLLVHHLGLEASHHDPDWSH